MWGSEFHILLLCHLFFFFLICLFFGYAGSSLLHQLFYSCSAQASHFSRFSRGAQALHCMGFSGCGSWDLDHRLTQQLWCMGLGCFKAFGIFLDQGLNLCLLHWQADSLALSHQGSPYSVILINLLYCFMYFYKMWDIFEDSLPSEPPGNPFEEHSHMYKL